MFPFRSLILLAVLYTVVVTQDAKVSLALAGNARDVANLSQIVVPSFAGLGIESNHLFAFLGHSTPNELSIQLIRNLARFSGVSPQMRLGGNSQDNMLYNPSVKHYSFAANPSPRGSGNYRSDSTWFGDGLVGALNRLPPGTPFIFGLNMAYDSDDYVDKIVSTARQVVTQLKNPTLIGLEIGNEPDIYVDKGYRTGSWDGQAYATQWLGRAQAVANQVLTPLKMPSDFFEPGTTANTIGKSFEIALLMENGINKTANGTSSSYISGWNQHDYRYFVNVSSCCFSLAALMNTTQSRAQFAYWARQVGIALETGYPYYLREMSNAGPVGLQGISDTFGAALWMLDFFLYAATLNISSVEMHMTDNSWAAPWQPGYKHGLEQHVRPSYYALAVMAQLVGNCNGTARIAEIDNGGDDRLRFYSVYANDTLRSIVLLNAQVVNASASEKASVECALILPDFVGKTLYLSVLTAEGADSNTGTVWNGLQFSNTDGSTSGDMVEASQNVTVGNDGLVNISVRNSQTVIANFDWVLGINKPNPPNSSDPRASIGNKSQAPGLAGSAFYVALAATILTTLAVLGSMAPDAIIDKER